MEKYTALFSALAALFWPAIAAAVLLFLRAPIRDVIVSRAFSLEIGGVKVSVGSSIEQINRDLAELKAKFSELDAGNRNTAFAKGEGAAQEDHSVDQIEPPTSSKVPARILWVDDKPDGNALAIDQLQSLGIDVDLARSTEEAMQKVDDALPPFDLVLSDVGRTEGSIYNRFAGLDLLKQLRNSHKNTPVVFYTTDRTAGMRPVQDAIRTDGNSYATGSTTNLFSLINTALRSHSSGQPARNNAG